MAKLSDGQQITTVNSEMIVLTTDGGETFRINKKDFAETIRQLMGEVTIAKAGLMGTNGFIHRGLSNDLNTAILSGMYSVGDFSLNIPVVDYGVVIVHAITRSYIVQVFYALNKTNRFSRISIDGLNFKDWRAF